MCRSSHFVILSTTVGISIWNSTEKNQKSNLCPLFHQVGTSTSHMLCPVSTGCWMVSWAWRNMTTWACSPGQMAVGGQQRRAEHGGWDLPSTEGGQRARMQDHDGRDSRRLEGPKLNISRWEASPPRPPCPRTATPRLSVETKLLPLTVGATFLLGFF